MATIDDIGGGQDSLGSVAFGGPTGWAAAVRDAIKGKVSKAGDVMTGALSVPDRVQIGTSSLGGNVVAAQEDGLNILKIMNPAQDLLGKIKIGSPTVPDHGATKLYVDELFWAQTSSATADWNDQIVIGANRLLMGPGCANHPAGNSYYYCFVFRYTTDNLTQIAIPYLPAGAINTFKVCIRGRYSGTWSSWGKLAIATDS